MCGIGPMALEKSCGIMMLSIMRQQYNKVYKVEEPQQGRSPDPIL
jgi:hypothetical protein